MVILSLAANWSIARFQRDCVDCTDLKSMLEVWGHAFTIAINRGGSAGPGVDGSGDKRRAVLFIRPYDLKPSTRPGFRSVGPDTALYDPSRVSQVPRDPADRSKS